MSDVLNAGFIDGSISEIPNYRQRYDWFVQEFVTYNTEIPDDLKPEYNALFLMFGQQELENDIEKRIQKYKVTVSDEIPMPEIVLSITDKNGQNKRMVMTRENISCVTAQAKVGKTFLVKLIVSAVLKRGLFQNRLLSELPIGRDKILYIDTEQSKFHVKLGLNQIREMLGEESERELNRMDVFQFDSVGTETRIEFVKHLIYSRKPDFVILDGISDLALDTNNLKEADELVTNLRIWATENKCHILNVIHQNPNDLQTKMKGHLGTKLQDKSEIVIGVSIDKDNESNRIVKSLASRNRRPDPFEFTITETGMPKIENYEVSEYKLSGKKTPKTDKPDYQLYSLLTIIFSKKGSEICSYRYGELKSQISLEFEKMFNQTIGDSYIRLLLTRFLDKGWVLKTGEHGHALYFLGEFSQAKNDNSEFNNENDMPF